MVGAGGYSPSMLDFTEIPTGEAFELLVRDMLVAMRYTVTWSGRGADGGMDLLVDEPGDGNFGAKPRRWLVSCKHNALAAAGKGRSVNSEDIGSMGGITDTVQEHGASAFLVACSTQPSSALVQRLTSIEAARGVPTHYWDSETLRRWLNTPACWGVAQRYMPKSADGPRVYATELPNKYIIISNGYFIRLTNRHASFVDFQLPWIEKRIEAIGSMALPEGFELRFRGVFYNDKVGALHWYLDLLYSKDDLYSIEEPKSEFEIAGGAKAYLEAQDFGDFQINDYEVNLRAVNRRSDSYDPDHYSYYTPLPGYL
ncbi:restriction endonuclease [Rhodococcus erythropolis]